MPASSDDDRWGSLGSTALILLPVLCCGLPLLIAAGALGGLGAALGNPWVVGAGALLAALVVWRFGRRAPGTAGQDCCASPPLRDRDEPIESATTRRVQEP